MKNRFQSQSRLWLGSLAVFALLVAWNYLPIFTGKIPFPRDIVVQFAAWSGLPRSEAWQPSASIGDLVTSFYPFRAFAAKSIKERTLPLWNPLILGGIPFQANSQSALFYPLNALYYVLPTPIAWAAAHLLRMFLSCLLMAMLVRAIGGSNAGAIFSGIVFASCGFMTTWQGQAMGDAAIWLPLICYSVHRLHETCSRFSIALTSFAFAMPVLAGHPETAAHLTAAGSFLALWLWTRSSLSKPRVYSWTFIWSFFVAGVLALGLAMIQILPTLEWLQHIGQSFEVVWPPLSLHQVLGWVSRDILRDPNSAGIQVPEGAAYIGMITLVAASLAVFHNSTRYVIFFVALTVISLSVIYGGEPLWSIVSNTPVLRSLKNTRLIVVASFSLAALAGLGISAIEEQAFSVRQRTLALILLASGFAAIFVLLYNLQLWTTFKVEFARRPSFARTLLCVGVAPFLLKLYSKLPRRIFTVLVCAIAIFDLATFSYGYTGFAAPDEIFPPASVFGWVAQDKDMELYRAAEIRAPYPSNASSVYAIPSADGYEIQLQSPRLFVRGMSLDTGVGINFEPDAILNLTDRRLDMLNVKYLIVNAFDEAFVQFAAARKFPLVFNNQYVAVFENKSVLPRAFLVPASGVELRPDPEAQIRRLQESSFDPTTAVLVTEDAPFFHAAYPVGLPFARRADITSISTNELALRVETSEPAVLVVSQTYYPGWHATVDGVETPVLPVDLALTGIPILTGTHEVQLVFKPFTFRAGMFVTVLSALILAALAFRIRTKPGALVANCAMTAEAEHMQVK
jgi:hypothetical protein